MARLLRLVAWATAPAQSPALATLGVILAAIPDEHGGNTCRQSLDRGATPLLHTLASDESRSSRVEDLYVGSRFDIEI